MTIPADIMKTAREAYHSAFNEYGEAKDVFKAGASAQARTVAAAIRKGDTA